MRLTDSEWKVMRCLWRHGAASAREVLAEVGAETGWAYTTVKTVLDRLVDKGAVRARKRGNKGHYEPLVSEESARRSALKGLVDRAFGGAVGGLLHFLQVQDEAISPQDRKRLEEMLAEAEGRRPAHQEGKRGRR